jgi:hypothetical protein
MSLGWHCDGPTCAEFTLGAGIENWLTVLEGGMEAGHFHEWNCLLMFAAGKVTDDDVFKPEPESEFPASPPEGEWGNG